jgi:dihydrofolate reductase
MGKIVSNFFIALDGVVGSPDEWHFPYFNHQMSGVIATVTQRAAAFLMGRVLYAEWAAYWPHQGEGVAFASFINAVPKYVISNTLAAATWVNTTLLSGDDAALVGRVQALKDETRGDIVLSGCATTVRWLLAHRLLDELDLLVHPIAVGQGQRLFEGTPTHPLDLVRHEVFDTGVLHLVYTPAPALGG